MANRDSATRSKRQIIAHAIILSEESGDFISLGKWTDLRLPYSHAADLACRGHVPLHQYRRYGEGVPYRSEEHTSELQSRLHLVCRLLLEKKKNNKTTNLTKKKTKNTKYRLHMIRAN